MKAPVFVPSDVTVLLAIAWASEEQPASLKDIIHMGDAVRRTIQSGPEIRRGIAKLLAMGYIEDRRQHFVLAGEALLVWQADCALSDEHWEQTDNHFPGYPSFERLLKPDRFHKPSGHAVDDPVWRYEAFDDESVRVAYEAYVKEFEAAVEEMEKAEAALEEQERKKPESDN